MSLRAAFAVLVLLCGSCSHAVDAPEGDVGSSCAMAGSGAIVEVGAGTFQRFEPLPDGSAVRWTYGPQGGTMLGLVIRLGGTASECMAHETVLFDDAGHELARTGEPVRPGNNVIFLILEEPVPGSGSALHVASDVGGVHVALTLFVD
jgi:hypothetical protein